MNMGMKQRTKTGQALWTTGTVVRPVPDTVNQRKAQRETLGLSQRALAEKAGVSQSMVSLYEGGRHVSQKVLDAIKAVLWGRHTTVTARATPAKLAALAKARKALAAAKRKAAKTKPQAIEAMKPSVTRAAIASLERGRRLEAQRVWARDVITRSVTDALSAFEADVRADERERIRAAFER